MARVYSNITETGTETNVLIKKAKQGGVSGNIVYIAIVNKAGTAAVVELRLNNKAGSPTYYSLAKATIPASTTLTLDEKHLSFNEKFYELELVNTGACELTVIIK
tara:strand:+ start:378 stop:692 length:315 start_codon:yes stop_codon:yes gene_type:complete